MKILYKKIKFMLLSFNPWQENEKKKLKHSRQKQFFDVEYAFLKTEISPHLFSNPFRIEQDCFQEKNI